MFKVRGGFPIEADGKTGCASRSTADDGSKSKMKVRNGAGSRKGIVAN